MTDERSSDPALDGSGKLSFTEVVPVISHKIHPFKSQFLIPAIIVAAASVVLLFFVNTMQIAVYTWLLGIYLTYTIFCVIYFYSRIDRPLWSYAIPVALIFIIMQVPLFPLQKACQSAATHICTLHVPIWTEIYLPFDALWHQGLVKIVGVGSVPQNIVAMIMQPGLREELTKAIPTLIAAGLTVALVPATYILAILLPPIGLLVNGQRMHALLNFVLAGICAGLAYGFGYYGVLVIVPIYALIAVFVHRSKMEGAPQPSRVAELLRVRSPLDGMMIGSASGLMFCLLENVFQYVPNIGNTALKATQDLYAKNLYELVLLIPRSIDSIIGHLAWAGISGYFIGLAVIRRKQWPLLLAIAWLVPAILHGFFDGVQVPGFPWWWLIPVDIFSLAIFLACLLKARQLHTAMFPDSDRVEE